MLTHSRFEIYRFSEDPSAFCSPDPQSHRVGIDPDCTAPDGSKAIDVGKCETRRCRQPQQNQTVACEDDETFCCGPTRYSRVDLVCKTTPSFVYVVSSCIT